MRALHLQNDPSQRRSVTVIDNAGILCSRRLPPGSFPSLRVAGIDLPSQNAWLVIGVGNHHIRRADPVSSRRVVLVLRQSKAAGEGRDYAV